MNSISTGIYTNSVNQPQSFKLDSSATRIIPNAEDAIDLAKPRNEEEAAYFASMHERMEESLQRQKIFLSNNSSVEQQYDRWEKANSELVHAVIKNEEGEIIGGVSEGGSTILTQYNTDEDKIAALKELYGDDVTVHLYTDEDAPTRGEIAEQRQGHKVQFRYDDLSDIKSFAKMLEGQVNAYNERVEGLKPAPGDIVDIET